MTVLWIDFETRSRCDLKTKGVYNYAQDYTTDVLCMSYAFDDEPVKTWAPFYTDYGLAIQKRFFDFYLKGKKNGWEKTPKVSLLVRSPGEKFTPRSENEWPLKRTQWTSLYLEPQKKTFSQFPLKQEAKIQYDMMGDGVTFAFPPQTQEVELTGPMSLKLFISSSTIDADIFAVVRVFDPNGKEVLFHGALDPKTPIAQGWLRASHRKLDKKKSLPYRPWHSHDEKQPLKPGDIYELDVEIWPTSIVIPQGYTLIFNVRGKDYRYDEEGVILPFDTQPMYGVGPFSHENPVDRPHEIFHTTNHLHFGTGHQPYILLPIIPKA